MSRWFQSVLITLRASATFSWCHGNVTKWSREAATHIQDQGDEEVEAQYVTA